MKHIIISIICACVALASVAGVPKKDAARLQRVLNNKSGHVAAPAAEVGTKPISLQQFMRENNVTPNDNRLKKKAPQRVSAADLQGTRIAALEAAPIDIDEYDNFIFSDLVYYLGWGVELNSDGDCSWIEGIFDDYSLPYDFDEDGNPFLTSSCVYYRANVGIGRNRTDTVSTVYFFTSNALLGDEWEEDSTVIGEAYDDGSIMFDGGELGVGFFWYENEYLQYRNGQLISDQTEYAVSPLIRNMALLMPNGVHQCTGNSGIYSHVFNDSIFYSQDYYSFVASGSGAGSGIDSSSLWGPHTNIVMGGGGLQPKPVGGFPTRSSGSPAPSSENEVDGLGKAVGLQKLINSQLLQGLINTDKRVEPLGGGGLVPRPPHRPLKGSDEQLIGQLHPTLSRIEAPVYLFQSNDSTVFVYNLYDKGSTINCLKIGADGSLTFPGQAVYNSDFGDVCNFTRNDDHSFVPGNTGYVSSDTLYWGESYLLNQYSFTGQFFSNSILTLADGFQFISGTAQIPTIEVTEGDDAYTFTAFSNEEGAVVTLLTFNDEGEILEVVDNPFIVQRTNQDQVINLAAFAQVPDKYDSDFCILEQVVIPAKVNNYQEGDLNHDGKVSITDVTTLINYLLNGDWE